MEEKKIELRVKLDDKNMPVEITWDADDNKNKASQCKAFMLSLYEKEHMETFKIDLWAKDFQIGEMDRFMFQTLRGMVDTYYRATQNKELANEMHKFVSYFGEKTGLIKPENKQ